MRIGQEGTAQAARFLDRYFCFFYFCNINTLQDLHRLWVLYSLSLPKKGENCQDMRSLVAHRHTTGRWFWNYRSDLPWTCNLQCSYSIIPRSTLSGPGHLLVIQVVSWKWQIAQDLSHTAEPPEGTPGSQYPGPRSSGLFGRVKNIYFSLNIIYLWVFIVPITNINYKAVEYILSSYLVMSVTPIMYPGKNPRPWHNQPKAIPLSYNTIILLLLGYCPLSW